MKKRIIIAGGGPAGITAANLLSAEKDYEVILFEKTQMLGGIAKTVNYKGNRIDIGGHRFFSKSDWVMDFWKSKFPIQGAPSKDDILLNRKVNLSEDPKSLDPEKEDNVLLIRNRLSRIFYLRSFFDYPVSLNMNTIKNLGLMRMFRIGMSYIAVRINPIRSERSLEDFFINRFGRELYMTFFKDYTEKVWGVKCTEIKPEWGAQRVKGLDVTKAILHSLKKIFVKSNDISQKKTETSLIEQFLYPKLGPGQLWEFVAAEAEKRGAKIVLGAEVKKIHTEGERVKGVTLFDCGKNKEEYFECDAFISTMPIKDLVAGFDAKDDEIGRIADGLVYRDFLTVGLLLGRLAIENETKIPTINGIVPDNWIYIQERDVKVGRAQIFNNWSPYLVKNQSHVWMGLEYFTSEGDEISSKSDAEMAEFAISEMEKIGFIKREDVIDSTVLRMEKAYPAYFGTYGELDRIREWSLRYENLYLVGRNGMHRYNNMDHSMLSAKAAVDSIKNNFSKRSEIWNINTEEDYHEEK
ncbi:MAG: NAD(P)/FAD-dependent oxidoreductase [bacterium]|nr:NAD(P)/FAD-dependent oxidoreductase [bacterium]